MSEIKVFTDNNKNYTLTTRGSVIGTLEYKYWYSSKAEVTIGEEHYVIFRKGFWGTQHEVKQDDVVLLILKTKWDGGIAIIKPKERTQYYEFKPKGFFTNGYLLTNYKNEELLLMTTDFSWKKFTSGYSINCNDTFGTTQFEQLLILISVYHYKAAQAMAMAAVAN